MTPDAAGGGVRPPTGGLVKYGTFLFAASMAANVSHYAFRIFMSHHLSDADYAALDALLSLLMIVSIPATAIQTATAKYASDLGAKGRFDELANLFRRSLRRIGVFCVLGLIAFVISSGFIADYLRIDRTAPVVLLGITLFIGVPLPAAVGMLQGLQRFVALGLVGIGGAAMRLGAGVALVLTGLGVNGAVGASVFSSFVSLAIVFALLRPLLRQSVPTRADSSGVYRYFLPVILFLTCQSLLSFVDGIVVKHYFDPEQAAVYFRAAIIGKAFLYLPTSLALVLFPKASERHALRESSFRLLMQAVGYALGVAALGAGVCYLFAEPLAVIVGGASRAPEVADLIRCFGLAVTPIALLQLFINHDMAVHRTSSIWPLMAGTIAFMGILFIFHDSPRQILMGMGGAGWGLCALCVTWTWIAERRAVHA